MSTLEQLDKTDRYDLDSPALDEKTYNGTYPDAAGKPEGSVSSWTAPEDWLERLKDEYSGKHDGESLPPGCDPDRFARAILTMNEQQAVETLTDIISNLHNDYTFDVALAAYVRELIQGPEACGLASNEWAYQVCKTAGIIQNWSAYLEVRACTLPYDDIEEPCETFRSYFVGFFWVIIMTAVNTCE